MEPRTPWKSTKNRWAELCSTPILDQGRIIKVKCNNTHESGRKASLDFRRLQKPRFCVSGTCSHLKETNAYRLVEVPVTLL